MIDPESATHRARLAKAVDYAYRDADADRLARRDLIVNFIGSKEVLSRASGTPYDRGPLGNLIQLAAIAHQITMAYGEPRWHTVAEVPDGDIMAPRIKAFLNRYSALADLGSVYRMCALDSFFGWGVAKVSHGVFHPALRNATKNQYGPTVLRISQDNFLWDGTVRQWDECEYTGNFLYVPLDEAMQFEEFLQYNPDGVRKLSEYTFSQTTVDSQFRQTNRFDRTPQPMCRLAYLYFPSSQQEAFWPAYDDSFNSLSDKPLLVRDWSGHYSGPHEILSLLDIPDNLIPTATAMSTLDLHKLFNTLGDDIAKQAEDSGWVGVHSAGADRDAKKLDKAHAQKKRWVEVNELSKIGSHNIPAPDQGKMAAWMGFYRLFKEFSGNLDDRLGLNPTAGTATQSQMIRQRTSGHTQDMTRRMYKFVGNTGKKLIHLALNDPNLKMPIRVPLDGAPDLTVDMSWLPPSEMPRDQDVDDYTISLINESLEYRHPQERLSQLQAATGRIGAMAQLMAMGIPIDLQYYCELEADYNSMPELRELFKGILVEYQAEKQAARGPSPRAPGVGEYTRENVSTQSNGGQMMAEFTQFSGGDSGGGGVEVLGQ